MTTKIEHVHDSILQKYKKGQNRGPLDIQKKNQKQKIADSNWLSLFMNTENIKHSLCSTPSTSRKHSCIILTPLKPHFYIVKLGFTGVYIIFLISAQKHRLLYSLEAVLTSTHKLCFWADIWKISEVFFYLKIFSFWRWNIWISVFS